jgi:hypothetical protein
MLLHFRESGRCAAAVGELARGRRTVAALLTAPRPDLPEGEPATRAATPLEELAAGSRPVLARGARHVLPQHASGRPPQLFPYGWISSMKGKG